MISEECKRQYEAMLEGGELKELFPKLSGDWERDKERFANIYAVNQALLEFDVDFEEEDGEDFYDD